ncbi:MAG: cation:proton antiporter, partial [Myxococcales bacterium]|nr:cation:proton antiporter [Myxococcales bacterium]
MKRLFLIGVLLAVIIGVEALQSEAAFGAGGMDPLTLATIGFVVLASFAGAELGGQLGLPKVTGFIVAGLLLGPQVGGILAPRVVEEMRMFNTLALGLIATGAGLELELAALRRLARTLGATIGIKLVMVVLFVGAPFVILELNFHVLGLPDTSAALGLGVVFAALAIGTSPAIALAVLSETKAKGRLSELVLGAAVLKDVVVVVCLAIAVSIARVLTSPDATMDAHVLMHVAKELGSSILAGGVLGGILILYIRWLGAEMLLFVASMILVVAEISHALHLELLLVFIVAGFVVRNFSPYEHKLMHPLELVSLPVFVVFFT